LRLLPFEFFDDCRIFDKLRDDLQNILTFNDYQWKVVFQRIMGSDKIV